MGSLKTIYSRVLRKRWSIKYRPGHITLWSPEKLYQIEYRLVEKLWAFDKASFYNPNELLGYEFSPLRTSK